MENSENTEIKFDQEKFLLLDKSFLSCLNCSKNSLILYKTSCCKKLLCNSCKTSLKSDTCPKCKIITKLKLSKVAKGLIMNSYTKCPICEFFDIFKNINKHLKISHPEIFSNLENFVNNKKLYEYIILAYSLELIKKSPSHDHMLNLTIRKPNMLCRGNETYHFTDCNFLKVFYSEQKEEEKILDLFCYTCEKCNIVYCMNCLVKDGFLVKAQTHQHMLTLKYQDNGWICDGSKEIVKCFSGITNYQQTKGMIRFRCQGCDYDLCENCIINHLEWK